MADKVSIMKQTPLVKTALIIVMLFFVYDCATGTDEQTSSKAKWVIMIYMCADNNLEYASIFNMNQLERVGSNQNIKILVQWDRTPGYDSSNGNWTSTKRFLVSKDDSNSIIASEEIEDLGEVNMGNTTSLVEFINWTYQKYPSERYALSLWNHGGGWLGHTYDDTSNTCLTLESLSEALKTAGFGEEKKLDLLIFDECVMGLIDIAYEVAPYTRVMIASEDVIPGTGIDFVVPLSELTNNPNMDEKELAKSIVHAYEEFYAKQYIKPYVTLAAYDMERMPSAISATDSLSSLLINCVEEDWPLIGKSLSFSESFARSDGIAQFKLASNYYDLFDIVNLIGQRSTNRDVKYAANELKNAIRGVLIAEYHGNLHPYAYGMTVYFPDDENIYRSDYPTQSRFASETHWDEFLRSYIAAEKSDEIEPFIEIDSIYPQPSNISYPARVTGNTTGNNIAYLYRSIGTWNVSNFIVLNEHQLYRYYLGYKGGRRLPEFVDGRNNIDFTWAPIIDVLTNGKKTVVAPAVPLRSHEYYFSIDGKYKSHDEPKPFPARLIFDYRTGKMISSIRLDDNDMQISEFEISTGDIFQPEFTYYDSETHEIKTMVMDEISFVNSGIWLEPQLLKEGRYSIGLYVEDLSGNGNWTWRSIDIAGQPPLHPDISVRDLFGGWEGYGPYNDTKFVFEFSDHKISEEDIQTFRMVFGLEFPLCSIWRWGRLAICAPGKEVKKAQLIYRIRNRDGHTWITVILFPENQSNPIYMAFLVDLAGNELHMRDIFESGEYLLRRSFSNFNIDMHDTFRKHYNMT